MKFKAPIKLRTTENRKKETMKTYADKHMSKHFTKFRIGQQAILLHKDERKMTPRYSDKLYKVVRQKGTSVKLRAENGQIIYRNVSHVRPYYKAVTTTTRVNRSKNNDEIRPHRQRKIPEKFNDYVLK